MKYRAILILNIVYLKAESLSDRQCSNLVLSQTTSTSQSTNVRCSDARGSNPQWRVNNSTEFHASGVARVRLMGVGFSVLGVDWTRVDTRAVMVECVSEGCRLVARLSRRGQLTQTTTPRTAATTTTRPTERTTTRPRSAILFSDGGASTRRPSGRSCGAAGRWRRRPGMDGWCASNCAMGHCPRGVCSCDQSPR